jgi:hypothetical protein
LEPGCAYPAFSLFSDPMRTRPPRIYYEIHARLGADGKPSGFYTKARYSRGWIGLPVIFCDHFHPDIESARACRYFDSVDREDTPRLPLWSVY